MKLVMLSVFAGGLIALQAGINSQLGVLLKNSLMATVVAFFMSAFLSLLGMFVLVRQLPEFSAVRTIPVHLWFGGVLSAIGVGLFYFLIPKMGVGSMMSFALNGQLMIAMLASHFGWFGLPVMPVTSTKVLGVFAMIGGIVLINR